MYDITDVVYSIYHNLRGMLGIELCKRLHLIALDCAGYEKTSAIYSK